jgi:UDP-glucose 4-epimerase
LCDAHVRALKSLQQSATSKQYNLGNGQGFSVQQVIDCAREVTGREIPISIEPRRPGDPAVLVADATRIKAELGWNPQFASLAKIIETAWLWEQSFFAQ